MKEDGSAPPAARAHNFVGLPVLTNVVAGGQHHSSGVCAVRPVSYTHLTLPTTPYV